MKKQIQAEKKPPMEQSKVSFWQSIQFRYALIYLTVVAAVAVLMNTYPVIMAQNMVFQSKRTSLLSQTAVAASALSAEVLTPESVEQAMLPLDDLSATRVLVTDAAGMILYDTSELEPSVYHYALLYEVISALRSNDVCRSEFRDNAFRSRAASPILYKGTIVGSVYLYEYDAQQGELLLSIQSNLRTISIVIALSALCLCLVFSRSLSRGIRNLLNAIRKVREGEYSHRVEINSRDELAQLADEFNQLTGRLQNTEEVRRRFVSDASHELKTPLASIRLLTDSILESGSMDPEVMRDFVGDIGEEAGRLTRISEKLLALTRLDAGVAADPSPVDVGRVIVRVQRMLKPLADAVEVCLYTDLRTDCYVPASDDEVYQIAFNLMENAVKYNLPGGKVIVDLRHSGDLVTLTVEDTGVGIPEEDRDKIFDRFYRVDKARSRRSGGTGLGLSIAKEIVDRHKGSLKLVDKPSPGLTVRLELPIDGPGEAPA